MKDDIIKNLCRKMQVTLSDEKVGVGFIMLPPLLMDYAKQMLDEKRGMFKHEEKKVYNQLCSQIHKYFSGLFSGMNIDMQCIICDMQDGMAESMKSYVDTFNYALQSEMMHIPTEIRKEICDFIIIKAIIETSSLVAERIMRRKDRELHYSYMISQKMLKLMFAPYEDNDNPIDLNNSDRVNQAAEIFINKLMQYQKIV